MEALDFRIDITDRVGDGYRIHVRAPDDEFTSIIPLDLDDDDLRAKLSFLPTVLRASSARSRGAVSVEEAHVQYIGARLFDQLTAHETLGMLTTARRRARDNGHDLRITLRIGPAELAGLPWEFLYDARSDRREYLGRQCLVVRHADEIVTRPPLRVAGPLRILAVAAHPADLPHLDLDAERRQLEAALAGLTAGRQIELRWIQGTKQSLLSSLYQGPWHVLHFIGHGLYDEATGEGRVAFVGPDGGSDYLSAQQLATTLATHATLRLAVFNACETGRGGSDPQSSIAAAMLHSGVSALVSMQFPITDHVATAFSAAFYEGLAGGLPVDRCVQSGRSAIWLANAHSLEWGTPTLHVRSAEGVLFDRVAADDRRVRNDEPPPRPRENARRNEPPKQEQEKAGSSEQSTRSAADNAAETAQTGMLLTDKLFASAQSNIQAARFSEALVRDLTYVLAQYETHYGAEHFWTNAARTALDRAKKGLAKERSVRVPRAQAAGPHPGPSWPRSSGSGSASTKRPTAVVSTEIPFPAAVTALAFSPGTTQLLAVGLADGTVHILSANGRNTELVLRHERAGQAGPDAVRLHRVMFAPPARQVGPGADDPSITCVTGSASGPERVTRWNGVSGEQMYTLQGHSLFAYRPYTSHIVTGTGATDIRLLDEPGHDPRATYVGMTEVSDLAVSSDGSSVAALGNELRVWKCQGGTLDALAKVRSTAAVPSVQFSRDTTQVFASDDRLGVVSLRIATQEVQGCAPDLLARTKPTWTVSGHGLAVGVPSTDDRQQTVACWDIARPDKVLAEWIWPVTPAVRPVFNAQGDFLATVKSDLRTVRLYYITR